MFTTDNGGPAAGFNQNAASNWPLKGVMKINMFNCLLYLTLNYQICVDLFDKEYW